MPKKALYNVRFVTPQGPEGFITKLSPEEFDELKGRLQGYSEGGDITDAEILPIDESTAVSYDQVRENLDARFGALEKGRPDVSRVDERFDPETERHVRDLLVGAFEGGSNYWYRIDGKTFPPGSKPADFKEGGRMQPPGEYYHWSELIPTYPGGSLTIREVGEGEGEAEVLDLAALKRGWILLKEKHRESYDRIMQGNEDASDGDLFLQLALFGEVVFG